MWSLVIYLLCLGVTKAHEALVLVGGKYPDGYLNTEVEVWSHSPDCGVHISNTPDAFADGPKVGVLDDTLYVCGGFRIGTNYNSDKCDIYNLTHNEWSEGPSLPFNRTDYDQPFFPGIASADITIVAAYEQFSVGPPVFLSMLTETGWSVPVTVDTNLDKHFVDIVDLDEYHVMLRSRCFGICPNETLFIVNYMTATVVGEIVTEYNCGKPFIYKNQYTCLKEVGDPQDYGPIMTLSYSQDFTNPTWTPLPDLPEVFSCGEQAQYSLTELDGMLTVFCPQSASLIFLDGEEWKSGELEIPREYPGFVVIPCNT